MVYGLPGLQLNPEELELGKKMAKYDQQKLPNSTASESERSYAIIIIELWPLSQLKILPLTAFQSCA
jgi:hypothetical protein